MLPHFDPPSQSDRARRSLQSGLRKKMRRGFLGIGQCKAHEMKFDLSRVIIFTENMVDMEEFYRSGIGLSVVGSEDGRVEFTAGRCNIALHAGRARIGNRPPKLVFYAEDVAAARAYLARKISVEFGPVRSTATFDMCDGKDPDGNPIQISSRK